MPKQGPRLGSRRQATAFLPIRFIPSVRPTEVVVLPSPAGVGLMAVTRMSLPSGLSKRDSMYPGSIFALVLPKGIKAVSGISSFLAISLMDCVFAFRAISISLINLSNANILLTSEEDHLSPVSSY